jgi:hypothetical protein
MLEQLFAGGGLGLLVGILVGLSASPVVSVIVGSLATGLVTLLGFVSPKQGEPASGGTSVMRLGAFGVTCAIAVVLGIFIRTHNWASPSIAEQVADVQKAGYSPEEARRWVAYKNIGGALEAPTSGPEKSREAAGGGGAPTASSVLFSGKDSGECRHFDTTLYKNTAEHLNALRQLGGSYAEYADKIGAMDARQQKDTLESLRRLYCPL